MTSTVGSIESFHFLRPVAPLRQRGRSDNKKVSWAQREATKWARLSSTLPRAFNSLSFFVYKPTARLHCVYFVVFFIKFFFLNIISSVSSARATGCAAACLMHFHFRSVPECYYTRLFTCKALCCEAFFIFLNNFLVTGHAGAASLPPYQVELGKRSARYRVPYFSINELSRWICLNTARNKSRLLGFFSFKFSYYFF